MITTHKIIKYLAYALAASIICGMIFGFVGLLSGLSNINDNTNNSKMISTNYKDENISILDIKLSNTNLKIIVGDYFKVSTNNEDISLEYNNNKLYIKEKDSYSFWDMNEKDIIIYIPKEEILENTIINTGAGNINIEDYSTKEITYSIGAGKSEIKNLYVLDKANIKCGAGKISVTDSSINNLDLDLGVGETEIASRILGISSIKTGVGSLIVNLTDSKDNYKILTKKGLGEIKIDNNNISNDYTYGNGNNYIKLEGGIGNININFIDNKKED